MTVKVGMGSFVYEVAEGWGRLPTGWDLVEVGGVAVDSQDRIFAFSRGEHPVIIFDRDGDFLGSWGEDMFRRAHGICIGPDDAVYCADDGGHTVRKFTPEGELLLTLGVKGQPSDTGYDGRDMMTIERGGPPFNRPTNIAIGPKGEIYVTDGYGNARIHKFAPDGQHLLSWGQPGTGPGEFHLPHGICLDQQGLIYAGDRQNNRIQVFNSRGEFVGQLGDVARPNDLCFDVAGNLYVAEAGHRLGDMPLFFPWQGSDEAIELAKSASAPASRRAPSRVSIFAPDGQLQMRLGGDDGCAPGSFLAAHGICVDSRGELYVAEVTVSATHDATPPGCPVLQKLIRVR